MTTAGNIMRSRALLVSESLRYTPGHVQGHRVVSMRGEGFIGVAAALSASEYVVLLLPGVTLLRERKPDTSVGEALFCEAQVQRSTVVLTINVAWRESAATPQQWRDAFADDLDLEKESDAFRDKLEFVDVPEAFRHLPDRVVRRYVPKSNPARLFQDVWLGASRINFEVMASVDNPNEAAPRGLEPLIEQAEVFVDRDLIRSWPGVESGPMKEP
ncbi:hypothetical protein ATI61_101587 [Archangium gephyra]|uniref:Uncharacterized protein n=2 Tax=Archangium gephyra TaxID=48 RepID=A0ABX9KBU1_9BACT|nr:hypothetical protein [Archangium gephyra]REG37600.1 hypothetical protein ATI61_101587 [Archangium gephyra]